MRTGFLVEATGFEPAALCSQSRCATKLRYASIFLVLLFFVVPSGCFARPLAVPKFFSGLERRKNLTAALRFARFFCHRQRSQNSPKADALPNCATPRSAFFMLKEYTLF